MLILSVVILAIFFGLWGFFVVGPLGPILYFLALILLLAAGVIHVWNRMRRRKPRPPR